MSAQRLLRFIRECVMSLYRAIKMLRLPPEGMTVEDLLKEASKVILAGVMVGLGVIIEEYIEKFLLSVPILTPYASTISMTITGIFVGVITASAIYWLDNTRDNKEIFDAICKEAHSKCDSLSIKMQKLEANMLY